ncbi:methyltransferase domain-containing protein [Candidatus Gracilibacteria bacterium]|nr:methyltransferase domain-containing protein [Candidatus Gracilibacteria bacterium]
MPKFNDLDLQNWKDIDLDMNSLWVIPERKKGGKHDNFYHGNFIPQIPEHFIKRYTKKGGWVLDPFLGSATTAIECEELGRNIIGIDIQKELVDRAKELIDSKKIHAHFGVGDSSSKETREDIEKIFKHRKIDGVDLALLHPPYADIIKFTDKKEDLSNSGSIENFLLDFGKVLKNTYKLLKEKGYMVIVMGDKYQNSEWIPLGFMCMTEAQKVGFKLKGVIVKNMEGNRGKSGNGAIWKYRALNSDYYLFKHEYILVFKK